MTSCEILVCVINSARDADYRASKPQLLIADEVHRYGTEKNSKALDDAFDERLGLSATYERDDGGVEQFIGPYFGATSYRLGYAQAIEQRVLAPFRLALVGADLYAGEQKQYDDLTKRMGADLKVLGDEIGFREPFGEFMKEVERLASDDQGPATRAAWRFTKMMNQRRELLADSSARSEAFAALVPTIRDSERAIVFGERVDQAVDLAESLKRHGLVAAPIHSNQSQAERKTTLSNFRKGRLQVIVAPHVLDEGIDVPEADLAVVVSTTRSRRQMIQRMGRVLRRKEGGGEARFVLIYARRTNEDPSNGAHGLFLDEVVGAASASARFDPPTDPADIAVRLAGGQDANRIDARPIPMKRPPRTKSGSKPTSLRAPEERDQAVAGHLGWPVEQVVDARLRLPRARSAPDELKANRLLADRAGLSVEELASWLSAELRASGRTEKQRRRGRHNRR